jgi:hypothetical protein
MGPDELVTREELGMIVRFMFAKFQQQTELVTNLCSLLQDQGTLTEKEILALASRLAKSESSKKATQAYEKLKEFAAIHKISRQYLDPPSE